jgi:hypothetical protein
VIIGLPRIISRLHTTTLGAYMTLSALFLLPASCSSDVIDRKSSP